MMHECYCCLYIKSERIHTTLLKSHYYYPINPRGTDVDGGGLLKEDFVCLFFVLVFRAISSQASG